MSMDESSTEARIESHASASTPGHSSSALDIPELLLCIAVYLNNGTLAIASRVNRSFHAVYTPLLWKSIIFDGDEMDEIWRGSEVFFKGLVQYGSQVQELRLRQSYIDPIDMVWVARHCTRLKVLDLTNTDATTDVLKHLINRDPYNILNPEMFIARLFNLEEEDESEDMNVSMERYRREASASLTRREQSRRQIGLSTGQFPYFLETIILDKCFEMTDTKWVWMVSLLGPQLKSLSLQGFPGVTDEILTELIRHCPNIVELKLFGHSLKDDFMRAYARKLTPTTPPRKTPRRLLERLEVDWTVTTSKGIAPLINACRSKMWNLRISRSDTIGGEVLYELLDDFHHKDAQSIEIKPGLTRTFAPNTVLTEVHLTYSVLIKDTAAGILFRYATELRIVDLEACYIEDGCLLELAATYRNRMQRLGLGIPAAWREHELALERVPYVERDIYDEDEGTASASASTKTQNTATNIPIPKIFSGTTVPGGLISLSIASCEWITNRGVRAIVRSCVGLQTLHLGYGALTSAELFHGPWACTQLVTLDIKYLPLQVSSIEQPQLKLEEDDERLRFPLAIDAEQGDEDDFGEDDSYDYIVYPDWDELAYLSEEENSSTDQDNEGSEGQTDTPTAESPSTESVMELSLSGSMESTPEVQEPEYRNTPLQRAVLRTFYARLGQLQHLQSLDMSCKFRVRVRDGLDLVLPGLRHSLASWDLSRDKEYKMMEEELIWIGKHFGYGYEYTEDASEREEQRGRQTESQRLSKLKAVQVCTSNISKVRLDLFDWLEDQSILIELTQPAYLWG